MADVFISYSKTDREIAETLSRYLRALNFSVWWDNSLVSGQNYRDTIIQELNSATAVVVIWTSNSVRSEWVISEAERASAQGKLFPFRTSDIDLSKIPQPFDTRHTPVLDADNVDFRQLRNGRFPLLEEAAALTLALAIFGITILSYFSFTRDGNYANLPLYLFVGIFSYLIARSLVWLGAKWLSERSHAMTQERAKYDWRSVSQALQRRRM